MNTFEILYQAFRARYSLTRVQELLDGGCKLALIGEEGAGETLRGFFGEPIRGLDGTDAAESLVTLTLPLTPAGREQLKECQGAIFLYTGEHPEDEELRSTADMVPLEVPCLWLLQTDATLEQHDDLTLPSLRAIPERAPGPTVVKMLVQAFPQLALILATRFAKIRRYYCRRLTSRTAARNGIIAACSSLPVSGIPVVGIFLGLLATSAETLVLTASQLRLCLLIAAIHGRPIDFFDRVGELWPVVGSAFGWRALARELIGFVPAAGWAMKTGIAYSGTWAVGEASRLFYEHGEPADEEVQRELVRRSRQEATRETEAFIAQLKAAKLDLAEAGQEDLEELTRAEESREGDES